MKNLPEDFLQIDGAIAADMRNGPAHRAMVEAINHLGHARGMKTIAEFASTGEIVDALRTPVAIRGRSLGRLAPPNANNPKSLIYSIYFIVFAFYIGVFN